MLTLVRLGLRCSPVLLMLVGSVIHAQETRVAVTLTGGHETDQRDGGRPVSLVAGALGVKPEVFREAFRGVTPSRNGPPSGDQARSNKAALMKVLRPLGVTNDRLDEVSNYYRYQPQRGEMWPTKDAKAQAVIVNGKVKEIVVTQGGSGYSASPVARISQMPDVKLVVNIRFDKDFQKNGSVSSIAVSPSGGGK